MDSHKGCLYVTAVTLSFLVTAIALVTAVTPVTVTGVTCYLGCLPTLARATNSPRPTNFRLVGRPNPIACKALIPNGYQAL